MMLTSIELAAVIAGCLVSVVALVRPVATLSERLGRIETRIDALTGAVDDLLERL